MDRASAVNLLDAVGRRRYSVTSGRVSGVVLAVLVGVYLVALYFAGRGFYFYVRDEWLLFSMRADPSASAYFRPFNGHLIAVPVLVYQDHAEGIRPRFVCAVAGSGRRRPCDMCCPHIRVRTASRRPTRRARRGRGPAVLLARCGRLVGIPDRVPRVTGARAARHPPCRASPMVSNPRDRDQRMPRRLDRHVGSGPRHDGGRSRIGAPAQGPARVRSASRDLGDLVDQLVRCRTRGSQWPHLRVCPRCKSGHRRASGQFNRPRFIRCPDRRGRSRARIRRALAAEPMDDRRDRRCDRPLRLDRAPGRVASRDG